MLLITIREQMAKVIYHCFIVIVTCGTSVIASGIPFDGTVNYVTQLDLLDNSRRDGE